MSDSLRSLRSRRSKAPKRTKPARGRMLTITLLSLMTVAALFLMVRSIVNHRFFRVERVAISGVERLDESKLRDLVADSVGKPILTLDLTDIRLELEKSPGVMTAVVARRLPDILDVRISERSAVARARIGTRSYLIDPNGELFVPLQTMPSDELLPRLQGLSTGVGELRLVDEDRAALRAIEALIEVTGHAPPKGTIVDMTPEDRILLRPGVDAPALWLDPEQPERNLRNLFAWKQTVARLAVGRAVDLRFPHRLTFVAQNGQGASR